MEITIETSCQTQFNELSNLITNNNTMVLAMIKDALGGFNGGMVTLQADKTEEEFSHNLSLIILT